MSWIAAAPAAFSAGKSLGEKLRGGNDTNTGTYSGDTAANIALDYYNVSQPLRGQVVHHLYEGLKEDPSLGGNTLDPTVSPIYKTGRDTIEKQYGVAKQNIIGSMPSGGQLLDKLADVETSRADALGGLAANSYQDMWNKAFQYATGSAGQSQNTLSGLAGSEAMLNAQKSAQKTQATSDIGYALGQMDWGSK